MNASIREPNEHDAERALPWTLFDPPEGEQRQSEETRVAGAAAQRPCGFVVVVLGAVGLANVTTLVHPDSHRVGGVGGSASER